MNRLGKHLCEIGAITENQLEEAIQYQVIFGGRIGTCLIELGFLKIKDFAKRLSAYHGVPLPPRKWLDRPAREAVEKFTRELVEERGVLPLRLEEGELHVAVLDPDDAVVMDEIRFASGCRVKPYVIPELAMRHYLQRHFDILWRGKRLGIQGDRAIEAAQYLSSNDQYEPGYDRGWEPRLGKEMTRGEPKQGQQSGQQPARAPAGGPGQERGQGPGPASGSARQTAASEKGEPELGEWRDAADANGLSVPRHGSGLASEEPGLSAVLSDLGTLVAREQEGAHHEAAGLTDERPTNLSDVLRLEAEMKGAIDRDHLIDIALSLAQVYARAAALFLVNRNGIQGFQIKGSYLDQRSIEVVLVPLGSDNFLSKSVSSGKSLRATPDRRGFDMQLLNALGRGHVGEVAIFPVKIKNRVVNVLYADNGSEPMGRTSFAALDELAQCMAGAYELLIIRRKNRRSLRSFPAPTKS